MTASVNYRHFTAFIGNQKCVSIEFIESQNAKASERLANSWNAYEDTKIDEIR